jgi:hypothetical protein
MKTALRRRYREKFNVSRFRPAQSDRERTQGARHARHDAHRRQIVLPRFGTGVIQAMMGDQIIVACPDGETKQFLLSYMLSSKQDQRT